MNFRIIAIFALILSVSFASSNSVGSDLALVDSNNMFVSNWWNLVIIGVAISVLIISACYMIGDAMSLPNLKAFAKQEIYEALTTAIIVAFIVASLLAFGLFSENIATSGLTQAQKDGTASIRYGACDDSKHIYPQTGKNPENKLFASVDWFLGCMPIGTNATSYAQISDNAKKRLDNLKNAQMRSGETSGYDLIWEDHNAAWTNTNAKYKFEDKGILLAHMMNIYASLLSLEMMLGPISTFGVSAYLGEPLVASLSFNLAPNAGLTPISEATIMLTDLAGMGLVTIFVQKVLLQFFHQNALQVFLPIGIAFRAIPFLRKTGSTILAISIIMYFIFPMSIWINQQVYFNIMESDDAMIMDWVNYQSMLEICTPERVAYGSGYETQAAYERRISENMVEPHINKTTGLGGSILDFFDIDNKHPTGDVDVSMPSTLISAVGASLFNNLEIITDYVFHTGSVLGPALPTDYFFEAMIDQFTTAMQMFILNLLFLINTIIISVTLFKDISLAIGGEPRIFGMTKLV